MVDLYEDRSNPHLRPDFVDRIFDQGSEDSFDDMLYDHDFEDFFVNDDDDMFMDEDLEDYEAILNRRDTASNFEVSFTL
ncbi:unnamed protein product [Euphydryas editha]|uniref:Uncharacterized protein n=1 Tax=Euphydryas editha TaxID=104508 RepID=A0AAU9TSJ4_EUPED|nr:unnamed protein product [Euphydryas editha]